jgi:hypothetical protein
MNNDVNSVSGEWVLIAHTVVHFKTKQLAHLSHEEYTEYKNQERQHKLKQLEENNGK